MTGKKILVLLIVSLFAFALQAGTFKLGQGGELVEKQPESELSKEVRRIKALAAEGKVDELEQAYDKLKADYPTLKGPEFDHFVKAEVLYCKKKFEEAYREYEKFLNKYPQSKFYNAAIEREYEIGAAYLQGRKKKVMAFFKLSGYAQGEKIMETLADRAGDAPIAINALTMVAQAYESKKDYKSANSQWSQIWSKWPSGSTGEQALLGMARCSHAKYKGPGFDNLPLKNAKAYYTQFKEKFPLAAEQIDADAKLAMIEEQLAYKKYKTATYYQRTSKLTGDANEVDPAEYYYDKVIEDWPASTAAKMSSAALDGQEVQEKVK